MTDEAETPDAEVTETEETSEAEEKPTDKVFTQADLDAASAKARNQGKRQGKKEAQQQMAQTKPQETSTEAMQPVSEMIEAAVAAATEPLHERLSEMQSKADGAEFTGAVAGLEITDQRKQELKALYSADRELFSSAVAAERAKDAPPQAKGPGYNGLSAPSATPDADRLSQPSKWTRDEIDSMKANGTFLANVKKYESSLQGSGGRLFPAKTPGKK